MKCKAIRQSLLHGSMLSYWTTDTSMWGTEQTL